MGQGRNYMRVLPRDLFNEASLLKCWGRLCILLENMPSGSHKAMVVEEALDGPFEVRQDPASGALSIANLTFTVAGRPLLLERPLNARGSWPFWVVARDEDADLDCFDLGDVEVFDERGEFLPEMLALIKA